MTKEEEEKEKERVLKKVDELIRRAKESNSKIKPSRYVWGRSSLHEIIKTPEQAARLTKQLRELRKGNY